MLSVQSPSNLVIYRENILLVVTIPLTTVLFNFQTIIVQKHFVQLTSIIAEWTKNALRMCCGLAHIVISPETYTSWLKTLADNTT